MSAPYSLVSFEHIEEMCAVARGSPGGGCFVEVGVYQGGTAYHLAQIAQAQGRQIYLYDTFTGIPHKDEIDAHPVGDFADTSVEQVRAAIPYAQVIEGVFPDSMVPMGPVAFVHLDADQYRSYMDSLRVLVPLMMPGGAMVYDDYGCLAGATTAVNEFFGPDRVTHRTGKAMVRF